MIVDGHIVVGKVTHLVGDKMCSLQNMRDRRRGFEVKRLTKPCNLTYPTMYDRVANQPVSTNHNVRLFPLAVGAHFHAPEPVLLGR